MWKLALFLDKYIDIFHCGNLETGVFIYWIRENSVFNIFSSIDGDLGPAKILACPICQEKVPNHILTQIELLS